MKTHIIRVNHLFLQQVESGYRLTLRWEHATQFTEDWNDYLRDQYLL